MIKFDALWLPEGWCVLSPWITTPEGHEYRLTIAAPGYSDKAKPWAEHTASQLNILLGVYEPGDTFYHAKDKTWWRVDDDGRFKALDKAPNVYVCTTAERALLEGALRHRWDLDSVMYGLVRAVAQE